MSYIFVPRMGIISGAVYYSWVILWLFFSGNFRKIADFLKARLITLGGNIYFNRYLLHSGLYKAL